MPQNGRLTLLARISDYRSLVQTPPGHPAGWFARSRIAFRTGQLSSRSVKASMISGASKARLRLPTLICLSMPTSTRRAMRR
jgi:hypothetical protein